MKKNKKLNLYLGNIDIYRDWGWAPEYVKARGQMLQLNEAEDFVIATGRIYGLDDFVREAFAALDLDWEKYVITKDALKRPSEIRSG